MKNVEVSIGSHTAITDSDGFYTLSDLTETEEAVVNFEKEGYLLGSTKILIKNYLETIHLLQIILSIVCMHMIINGVMIA